MKTRKRGQGVTIRLNTGAAILEAAKAVDTEPIKDRLSGFASITRSHVAADLEVNTAAAKLRAGSKNLQLREAGQDAAVESLARALIADGQSRTNPFAPFGSGPPSTAKQLKVVSPMPRCRHTSRTRFERDPQSFHSSADAHFSVLGRRNSPGR